LSFLVAGKKRAAAELGTDFNTADPVARFPVGALVPGCITVNITQDTSVEGDHTFSVSLNPGPVTPTLTVGTPDTTVITITDDTNDSKRQISSSCNNSLEPLIISTEISPVEIQFPCAILSFKHAVV